jgi:hypothetical protein
MADNRDTNNKIIKESENNDEGIESSQMNMSDTISNNSTLIKENKKLDIYEDDISLNSNNLIKNVLVVKDAKINQD